MSILTGYAKRKLKHFGKYRQNPHNSLRRDNSFKISKKATIYRRDNAQEAETEVSNDVGTTDHAIGDVKVEEMITTPGQIPNEMYEIENTPPGTILGLDQNLPSISEQRLSRSKDIKVINESSVAQPSIFLIIGIVTGSLLLLICIITCAISKVKKKNYKTLSKKDVECCTLNRPLLSMCEEKGSSSTCCRN